jgi:hypothetical protein
MSVCVSLAEWLADSCTYRSGTSIDKIMTLVEVDGVLKLLAKPKEGLREKLFILMLEKGPELLLAVEKHGNSRSVRLQHPCALLDFLNFAFLICRGWQGSWSRSQDIEEARTRGRRGRRTGRQWQRGMIRHCIISNWY